MKIKFALAILLVFMTNLMLVGAQRVCDPFTTTPDAGMLPIGQVVDFHHYEGGMGSIIRTGKISAYYIQSCFPGGGSIVGLDPQAYVVDYGSADRSQVVLNRGALTLR